MHNKPNYCTESIINKKNIVIIVLTYRKDRTQFSCITKKVIWFTETGTIIGGRRGIPLNCLRLFIFIEDNLIREEGGHGQRALDCEQSIYQNGLILKYSRVSQTRFSITRQSR